MAKTRHALYFCSYISFQAFVYFSTQPLIVFVCLTCSFYKENSILVGKMAGLNLFVKLWPQKV